MAIRSLVQPLPLQETELVTFPARAFFLQSPLEGTLVSVKGTALTRGMDIREMTHDPGPLFQEELAM